MAELWESKVAHDEKTLTSIFSALVIKAGDRPEAFQIAALTLLVGNQAIIAAKLDHAITQNAEILSRLPPALVVGVKCGTCGGSGKLPVGDYADSKPCPDCKGTGKRP